MVELKLFWSRTLRFQGAFRGRERMGRTVRGWWGSEICESTMLQSSRATTPAATTVAKDVMNEDSLNPNA